MFYINFRLNPTDGFTMISIKGYKLAKSNFIRLVNNKYYQVELADYEGEILLSHNK